MSRASDVSEVLATLQARWGSAAPRSGGELGLAARIRDGQPVAYETEGALARAVQPLPLQVPADDPLPGPMALPGPIALAPAPSRPGRAATLADSRVIPTGFTALDEILGTGGLPRSATVALRGDASSGKTTLALRLAAEAQAAGSIVAWLDLARAFDPVEAVSRGVRPEWLVVLMPADLEEALAMAGSLLAARTVDLLVVDLPDGRDPAVARARVGDRLGRLAALARRAGTLLVLLEPVALGRSLAAAVEEASGLRLELRPEGWIRLGRDVVGRRSEVTVARNRYGPPGRRADLEILYADGGVRDACLRRDGLLDGLAGAMGTIDAAAPEPLAPPGEIPPAIGDAAPSPAAPAAAPPPPITRLKGPHVSTDSDAPAAPALASSAPPPGEAPPGDAVAGRHLRLVAARPDRPRRPAMDGRDRPRRGPARAGARCATRAAARERPPAGARGDLPRSRP
jgi:recombination protein RecA